jgi:glycosyltransferase involved in cell wall biosynthesis
MTGTPRPTRILELRSVRGTGGGPEKTILLGATLADRREFNITVCYLRDQRDGTFALEPRARALGVDYTEIMERHSFDTRVWPALKRLVRDRGIDIVHAHEYKTDALAWLLGRRTGVVPLATAHGWTGHSARERYVYYPADKRLLARLPHVVAVSTDIRNELLRHGARPDRVTVILNGIDPAEFRRDPAAAASVRTELGFDPGHLVVGAVGRLEPQKRFDRVLECVARLTPSHPAIRLVVAGDGSLRTALAETAGRLGIADRCQFLGHRSDVARLHHAFDLFVQSSTYEGTPNAVLEAMAMETPIVATSAGGTSELSRDGREALIVPPDDVEALSAAMRRALADPAGSRARVAAARQRVETELSFAARTRRLEAVYADLARARSAHA